MSDGARPASLAPSQCVLRPLQNVGSNQCEYDSVTGGARDAQSLRPFGGDVNRHGTPAGLELDVAAGSLFGSGYIDAAVLQEIADEAQPLFEIYESGRRSSEAIHRPVAGAHANDGTALGYFIQRGKGMATMGGRE